MSHCSHVLALALPAAHVTLRASWPDAPKPYRVHPPRHGLEPRRPHRPERDRLPRPQGGGRRRAGDDLRLGVGRSDHPGLVRVDRPVGRAQRAGAARAGRRGSPPRGALHLPDDPHGTPRQLPHLRRTPAGALGPAGGVTPRGAGAPRGRRATRDRRAVRRGRAATGAVRLGRRRGDLLRRPPDRAVLRPPGQHPHGRVRRQPGEPHPLRPGGARGRSRGGVRRLHRRAADGGRPVPDRRARAGGHDRDRAQPDVVGGRRPDQRQRRHRRHASGDGVLRARGRAPRRRLQRAGGPLPARRRRAGARRRSQRRARGGRGRASRPAWTWSP